MLSEVVEEMGDLEEAQKLRFDVMQQLKNLKGGNIEGVEIDEAFFDQFVLFCHR